MLAVSGTGGDPRATGLPLGCCSVGLAVPGYRLGISLDQRIGGRLIGGLLAGRCPSNGAVHGRPCDAEYLLPLRRHQSGGGPSMSGRRGSVEAQSAVRRCRTHRKLLCRSRAGDGQDGWQRARAHLDSATAALADPPRPTPPPSLVAVIHGFGSNSSRLCHLGSRPGRRCVHRPSRSRRIQFLVGLRWRQGWYCLPIGSGGSAASAGVPTTDNAAIAGHIIKVSAFLIPLVRINTAGQLF